MLGECLHSGVYMFQRGKDATAPPVVRYVALMIKLLGLPERRTLKTHILAFVVYRKGLPMSPITISITVAHILQGQVSTKYAANRMIISA